MEKWTQKSDICLINDVKDGNLSAFNELVLRYESKIAGVVIGMLGPCPEADDVGQEVFIRFYKYIGQFRGESSLATYLTRIAINLSLNELKKRKKHQNRSVQLEEAENIPDGLFSEFDLETAQTIENAIDGLPAKYRSVVVLRLVEGYSTKETAEILALPNGTVLSRLSRATQKLRTALNHLGSKI